MADIIKKAKTSYIVDENGNKKSVIIPYKEFLELMEDLDDLAKVAERREEPTVSQDDLISQLKKDGLI